VGGNLEQAGGLSVRIPLGSLGGRSGTCFSFDCGEVRGMRTLKMFQNSIFIGWEVEGQSKSYYGTIWSKIFLTPIHEGFFGKHNLPRGPGKVYYYEERVPTVKFIGNWKGGKIAGYGACYRKDGTAQFIGQFYRGPRREVFCVFKNPDGSIKSYPDFAQTSTPASERQPARGETEFYKYFNRHYNGDQQLARA
jgi:hypothetical protein